MKTWKGIIFQLIITSLFFTPMVFSQDYSQYEGKKIKEIQLEGLKNTSEDLILGLLTLSRGDKFSVSELRNNFKNLYEIGFFRKIETNAKLVGDEVVVKFTFEELPKVGAVAIEGEGEIEEKTIISVMALKPGSVFKKSDIIKDEKNILGLYKVKGFENTTVQLRARIDPDNQLVNVIVKIQEGEEAFLESIKIIGTKALDPDDIYDRMASKESTLFRGGEVLNEEKLNFDRLMIERFFKDHGYWDGGVKSVKIKKDYLYPDDPYDQEKGYFVLIEVEEGSQYKMGKVTFSGNKVFKTEELEAKILSKPGDIFNFTKFQEELKSINDMYMNKGYIQVQLIPTPKPDTAKLILNWDVHIAEGQKVHIEEIHIHGHEKTRTWVIDQELRIFEGEIYNLEKIKKSQNKLNNTQFFSGVIPSNEPGSDDGLVNLNLKVEEGQTGLITVGAGYGTLAGFSVFEEVTEKNLFGTGWGVRERVEVGERQISIELGASTQWLIPYLPVTFDITTRYLRSRLSAGYSIYSSIYNANPFNEYSYKLESYEVDFKFGHWLNDEWIIWTGYLISFSKATSPVGFILSDVDQYTTRGDSLYRDLDAGLNGRFLTTISHRFGASYDSRDLVINTRNGWRIRGTYSYTGGIYSGDSQWMKWSNDYAYYTNPVWDLVFALFAGYDVLFKQADGSYVIRDIDRLRFDGFNELRGWRSFYRDEIVGQGGKVSLSAEIRFPLFTEFLWPVIFADAGDVTNTIGSVPGHLNYYSFGFGFRIQVPMIPIRLYFAKRATTDSDYKSSHGIDTGKFFIPGMEVVFSVGGHF